MESSGFSGRISEPWKREVGVPETACAMECGGKRQRDTVFGRDFRRASPDERDRLALGRDAS